MSEFENIRAIRNFINVSKGRKPVHINKIVNYWSIPKDRNERIYDRQSRRCKQVERREKAWKKQFGQGVFSIIGSSRPFQDPNIEIAELAK